MTGKGYVLLQSSWGKEKRSFCSWLLRWGKWLPLQRLAESSRTVIEHRKNKGKCFAFWGHTSVSRVLPHTPHTKRMAHSMLPCSLGSYFQAFLLAGTACIPSPRLARFILLYFCNSIWSSGLLVSSNSFLLGSLPPKARPIWGQMAWKGPGDLSTTVRAGQTFSPGHRSSRNSLPWTGALQNC